MDVESRFESELRERVQKIEEALAGLTARLDAAAPRGSTIPAGGAGPTAADARAGGFPSGRVSAPPRRGLRPGSAQEKGADWWLARAGAALTILAVFLLYRYAVGHGWITPVVRVLAGIAIGAGAMYWGRKLEPAADSWPSPVAVRELLMGAGLATWYITSFAAALSYHLISVPTARLIFLALSVCGGLLALEERRALLAIVATATGFATPGLLSNGSGSIPALSLFLAMLGVVSVYLYLMRGWQSVLWIACAGLLANVAGAVIINSSLGDTVSLTVLLAAATCAMVRATVMRRELVATNSERYTEPVRSTFARTWLAESGKLLRMLSIHATSADSISVWTITLALPIAAIVLLASVWNIGSLGEGILAMAAGYAAFWLFTRIRNARSEVRDVLSVATVLWSLSGLIWIANYLASVGAFDPYALPLALVGVSSIALLRLIHSPDYRPVVSTAKVLSAVAVSIVFMRETGLMSVSILSSQRSLLALFSLAEALGIAAGIGASLEIAKNTAARQAATVLMVMTYLAFLLVVNRFLGAIWPPLVTTTYALAGAAMLIRGRGVENRPMQTVGGATLALVVGRLMFVDLVGVDTIWRVLLFLGCGALFLFTSHQIQTVGKQISADTV